ncbi:hypothetical protein FB45DRAFT_1059583 [Roridomyces roridus]|uniref:Uncharacterized protein n=1 Tax=Roridomyces roridus TaxID=1738132 RepID=A0AAD7FMQ2_9AGAR|nr:hypothetical protein FB45DRAFT_1059583 [Roridomyces roridus]
MPALSSLPSLERLTLNIRLDMRSMTDPLTHRLFRNITHLDVVQFPPSRTFGYENNVVLRHPFVCASGVYRLRDWRAYVGNRIGVMGRR